MSSIFNICILYDTKYNCINIEWLDRIYNDTSILNPEKYIILCKNKHKIEIEKYFYNKLCSYMIIVLPELDNMLFILLCCNIYITSNTTNSIIINSNYIKHSNIIGYLKDGLSKINKYGIIYLTVEPSVKINNIINYFNYNGNIIDKLDIDLEQQDYLQNTGIIFYNINTVTTILENYNPKLFNKMTEIILNSRLYNHNIIINYNDYDTIPIINNYTDILFHYNTKLLIYKNTYN